MTNDRDELLAAVRQARDSLGFDIKDALLEEIIDIELADSGRDLAEREIRTVLDRSVGSARVATEGDVE